MFLSRAVEVPESVACLAKRLQKPHSFSTTPGSGLQGMRDGDCYAGGGSRRLHRMPSDMRRRGSSSRTDPQLEDGCVGDVLQVGDYCRIVLLGSNGFGGEEARPMGRLLS